MNALNHAPLFAAEFVFPGHPDKLADAIADALVAEAVRREPRALAGVEVAVHRRRVFVTGRIGCRDAASIDVAAVVREVYRTAGYDVDWYPSPDELLIDHDLCLGPLEDGEAEFRELADDQAICVGHAVANPHTNWLPIEQFLAQRLARRLNRLRLEVPELRLGPDGKVIVGVTSDGREHRLLRFSCSLQQKVLGDEVALHRAVRVALGDELQRLAIPGLSLELPATITVNGAGAFEVGGPEGDNGLAGKKLVMDAYGPRVPIGGGAWSGKDFFKADRAGGIHARRLAKLIVTLGLAESATVTLGWQPGDREPAVLRAEGVALGQARRCAELLDGALAASGERWSASEDLVDVARWGHFAEARAWEALRAC
ncbi:MAG: methionine adenosyltransferase domain-containing protein [Steroidobacteraceae bacterium]|nr:methionine adenosyltransferase domain-containing protein [Steroidobacteraceae bacterium]